MKHPPCMAYKAFILSFTPSLSVCTELQQKYRNMQIIDRTSISVSFFSVQQQCCRLGFKMSQEMRIHS